eukprot:scaffold45188_cov221-Amphora_coffeaeformis.AAC.1
MNDDLAFVLGVDTTTGAEERSVVVAGTEAIHCHPFTADVVVAAATVMSTIRWFVYMQQESTPTPTRLRWQRRSTGYRRNIQRTPTRL